MSAALVLSPDEARRLLLRATAMVAPAFPTGTAGVVPLLDRLGCVQVDPIDRVGTSTDLVFHARVDDLRRGDWAVAMPGHGFEHFAKERCLLPARLFPAYRDQAAETPWWRLGERLQKLDPALIAAVLAEIEARGPVSLQELGDHGRVEPMDWGGWKGTSKAASLAVEVLWTRCEIVTAGRRNNGHRVYDLPARALSQVYADPGGDFDRTCLLERVDSAGLLSENAGPWWSMLSRVRTGPLPQQLVDEGLLRWVQLPGGKRRWLCRPAALDGLDREPDHDDRLRIVAPLDPLIWDRALVRLAFGFDYIWEIYKPEAQRRWGYYVCPLLYGGQLVGRIEARRAGSSDAPDIEVMQLWGDAPAGPLAAAIERLRAFQAPRC